MYKQRHQYVFDILRILYSFNVWYCTMYTGRYKNYQHGKMESANQV